MTESFRIDHTVTFEETNLVKNVYFAHYARWQGHCREHFLNEHAPGVVAELMDGSLALVTVSLNIDYFGECFAGDVVTVAMSLGRHGSNRVTMLFDYLRGEELVARGSQTVACMRRVAGDAMEPVGIPEELRTALSRFER